MFKTQLIDARHSIDLKCAEETPYTGDPTLAKIRLVVEWALTGGWEEGRFNASEMDHISVAVWLHDVLIGVYTMDAEEVCPRWYNLREWPF
jgi:hypothetical protein